MCEMNLVAGTIAWDTPLTSDRFVMLTRHILGEAVQRHAQTEKVPALLENIRGATAHSARVTIVSALAHHGAGPLPIMMQGNWKSDTMPAKYFRDRKAIPLSYVWHTGEDLKRGWLPPSLHPGRSESGATQSCQDAGEDAEAAKGSSDESEQDDDSVRSDVALLFYVSQRMMEDYGQRVRHPCERRQRRRQACLRQ